MQENSWPVTFSAFFSPRLLGQDEESFCLEVTAAHSASERAGHGTAHLLHGVRSLGLRLLLLLFFLMIRRRIRSSRMVYFFWSECYMRHTLESNLVVVLDLS